MSRLEGGVKVVPFYLKTEKHIAVSWNNEQIPLAGVEDLYKRVRG